MIRAESSRRLLALLRPHASLMAISAFSRVVNQGLGVLIPAIAVALVIQSDTTIGVWPIVGLLALLALVKGTFRYVEQFTGHAVAFRLLSELRVDVYRSIVPLSPAGLEDERAGDLMARVVGDIDRVEPFYAHTIAPLASGILVPVIAAAGLGIWVDQLTAVVFVAFPLLMSLVVPWLGAKRTVELSAKARTLAGEASASFTDSVQGAREVAIFGARDSIARRIDERSQADGLVRGALAKFGSMRSGLTDLLAGMAVVAVAGVAVARYQAGAMDLAGLAAAIVVAWVGTNPARALSNISLDFEHALAAAGRLFELADRPPPLVEATASQHLPNGGDVEFSSVTVSFSSDNPPALDGVSALIPDKSFVAVVGPSGSGKSTLVELLARFRDPDDGRVILGGSDLKHVEPAIRRARVTFVPQRPDIFFGSIEDNLRIARPSASHDDLWEALDRAALGAWVRDLDHGLEASIGELGEMISGGQRQRLALARAFLRDSQVLVLDEATSELDIATERMIMEEIKLERASRTILMVAHRLESVTDADNILVLDRGRLVEEGTHDQLVAAGGTYARLWDRHMDILVETG